VDRLDDHTLPPGPRSQPGGRRSGPGGQFVRFVTVGGASTVAYILLYLLLRDFLPAQAANAISLLVTAVANTGVNRRLTFGIRGRAHAAPRSRAAGRKTSPTQPGPAGPIRIGASR
jgi:hypothetical protein